MRHSYINILTITIYQTMTLFLRMKTKKKQENKAPIIIVIFDCFYCHFLHFKSKDIPLNLLFDNGIGL